MAIMFTQPTFKVLDDFLNNMYRKSDFGPNANEYYNAFINNVNKPKTCLSCGARTNNKGQLPCGH